LADVVRDDGTECVVEIDPRDLAGAAELVGVGAARCS
jgi:hypothetical protein